MGYEDKPWLKSYDPWVEPEMSIPKTTLVDLIEQTVRDFPNRPAFHFFDLTWSYKQLMQDVNRFASLLSDHGLKKGDVLAIHLVNCPQYLIALFGALRSGVVVSGLSPLLTREELAYQLADSGAKAVVTLKSLYEERLVNAVNETRDLRLILVTELLDMATQEHSKQELELLPDVEVEWLRVTLHEYPDKPDPVRINPEDLCFIQYTGGTTGVPKGAMLTHENIVANVLQYGMWLDTVRGRDVLLCAFPMFHIAGLFHAAQSMVFAFTQILVPNPREVSHIVEQMATHRPTFVATVPALSIMLLQEPGFRDLDFSRLEIYMCGAAPFPVEKANELESVIGPNKLIEVFGMTETSPLLTANPRDGVKKVGSIGVPLASTRLKLVDLKTGEAEVPQGQEGEIIAAGPQVMKGYYNKPDETRKALREHEGEHWVHTGDVARMDEDGFFFLVDRVKDMINVGGYKVFSTEVEHKLSQHPAIELCALLGMRDPKRPGSEIVKLVVETSKSHRDRPDELVREEILTFAREKLAPYKVPKIVEFVESIPLTGVGKVDKKSLR